MEHKLTPGNLLNHAGNLCEAGYSTGLVKIYDRKMIKAGKLRIKEWDYYLITDGKRAVALTLDDNSYMSMASASYLDFENPSYTTKSEIKLMSRGKLNFPPSYEKGDIFYKSKKVEGSFIKEKSRRILKFFYKDFQPGKDFKCELVLTDEPHDKMVIATPFLKPKHFYYNAKINCMRAEGFVSIGDEVYNFSVDDTLGTLDWGRGVWTYKNVWYWGSLSCYLDDGRRFGWNIGYGFGDTSKASENMIFLDGVCHKLDKVTFNIPKTADGKKYDYMSKWTFTDNEGRFNVEFTPIIDRCDNTDLLVLCSKQHQVFGKMNGFVILDDGTRLEVKDKLGFAERVFNKW